MRGRGRRRSPVLRLHRQRHPDVVLRNKRPQSPHAKFRRLASLLRLNKIALSVVKLLLHRPELLAEQFHLNVALALRRFKLRRGATPEEQ